MFLVLLVVNSPSFRAVSILGVGLLGGSIGLALRRAGFAGRILGFGHRQSSLDAALTVGAIDAGFLDLRPAVESADLVILAGPIGLFPKLLRELRAIVRPDAVVADVGSTKRQVVAWAKKFLPRSVRFVGSHPIAGSDRRGVQFARADLFDGACCVLTPATLGRGTSLLVVKRFEDAVERVEAFWQSLGMWTCRMTPARHDRCLAEISHLPHAAAVALMLQATGPARELAGTGFLDCTRIAGGDPELWRDIFLTNSAEVVRSIRGLAGQLNKFASLIARGDSAGLVRLLAEAQKRRTELMERKLKGRQAEG